MSHIILKCVYDKSKLRIKFHSYVDENGKHYSDVYNNNYNCRFPRNLRKINTYYKIPFNDLSLSTRTNCEPFYLVKPKNIKTVNILDTLNIYKVEECLICWENSPNITLVPCGHLNTCHSCYLDLSSKSNKCPLCRSIITQAILTNN